MAEFNAKCPHCSAELAAEEDWIGMEVECPACKQSFTLVKETPKAPRLSLPQIKPAAPAASTVEEEAETSFIFACPECGTQVELPIVLKGKKYECKACCEESIAEPATEKKCPHCGQMIKSHATICKFCKKNVDISANASVNLQPISPIGNRPVNLQPIQNNNGVQLQPVNPIQNNPYNSVPVTAEKEGYGKKKKILIVIGCIIGFFIILGIIGGIKQYMVIESEIAEVSRIDDAGKRLDRLKAIQKVHSYNPLKEKVDNLIRKEEKRMKERIEEEKRKRLAEEKRMKERLAEEKRMKERIEEEKRKRLAEEKDEIERKIKEANDAKTVEEAISILEEILSKHPNHYLSSKIKDLIENKKQYIEECNIVRSAIQKAKDVKTYDEAFRILESTISQYPNNYYTSEAKELLAKYKQELAETQSKPICPACNGKGKYSRYWNDKYNKSYTCCICGGAGRISSSLRKKLYRCELCNGSGEHSLGGIRGICRFCKGAGWQVNHSPAEMGLEER